MVSINLILAAFIVKLAELAKQPCPQRQHPLKTAEVKIDKKKLRFRYIKVTILPPDECPDGQQLTQAGVCQPCQKGFYRSKGSQKTCAACPSGMTTEKEGSMTKENCNTRKL